MFQLQPPGPLSASHLWTLQQRSYAALGMDAWSKDNTPSYITSNPHFANNTARVILAALLDLGPQPAPIPILELGAGSGRFSWLLHQQLTRLANDCPLPVPPWCLVMTDTAPSLIRAWRAHPQLGPLIRTQQLDVARFDVSAPTPIRLQSRNAMLPPGPRIVLANYLWDSVPQDAYEVGGEGPPQAMHIGLLAEEDPSDRSAAELVPLLRLQIQRAPLPEDLSPALHAVLKDYDQQLSAPTSVLVPVAAARCLSWLARDGPVIALSADKGIAAMAHILDGESLPVTLHGGTASMTVDFTVLSALLAEQGGWSRCGDPREPLFLHHIALLGHAPAALSRCLLAFDQAFQHSLSHDLYRLSRATVEEGILPSMDRLLAMLGLTQADPDVFWVFSQAIEHHMEDDRLTEAEQVTLRALLPAILAQVYHLPGDQDALEETIARMGTALSAPVVTADAWTAVIAHQGPSLDAFYGQAVALSLQGRPQEALGAIQQALTFPCSHERHAHLSQWAMALQAWASLG